LYHGYWFFSGKFRQLPTKTGMKDNSTPRAPSPGSIEKNPGGFSHIVNTNMQGGNAPFFP
jgi:hypothetical protein